MTEEFDEDVVFENSPLFQYLHDLGHTDFEACPSATHEEESGEQEGDSITPDHVPPKTTRGRLWSLAQRLWRWSPLPHASAAQKLEQQLDALFGQYSVRCILDQDVLLQEDVELIELLDPALLTLDSSPPDPSRVSVLPKSKLFAKPSSWDMAALAGLTAVLLGFCSVSGGLWSLAAFPWGLALMAWLGARGSFLWREGCMQRKAHAGASQIQVLLHNSKTLTGLSRKALRLVQETEVISRGFTLVSAAGSFSRAGPGAVPRGQQLIGLRKTLYRVLRSAFRASRRATCHMLKSFPLNSEIDNVTNYVSAVPLKELGLGLGIEHLGDEQAQELTDDYSLPALKLLFQLWVGQSSECFRRLALLLSPRQPEETKDGATTAGLAPPPPLYQSIVAVTEPLGYAMAACLGEVQRSYDFHRHLETQSRTPGSEKTNGVREKCRELNSLHASIRSLQLHLKAMLSEMIILEDDLEKLMVSKEPSQLTLEGYQDLSERLHQLQPHMQASAGCWDDTVGQVDRMVRRAGGGNSVNQVTPSPCEIPLPPPSYPLILDRDPVPEELEWEAYVSESESDGDGRDDWCDMLTQEERDRQRREREESRRVLSELKSVLGFRASEGERMKRKQMLFNEQAAVAPSASNEGSDPVMKTTDAPASVEPPESGDEAGKHLSELPAGKEDEEGRGDHERRDRSSEPTIEFSCGSEERTEEDLRHGGGGASELHQYDGDLEEEAEEMRNGLDRLLPKPKVPGVTVLDRLAEMHGSDALSFSSALAAQVAARSQSLVKMEEQMFGDDDDDDDDDEEEEEEEESSEHD